MLTFGTIVLGPDVAIGSSDHPSFFHMLSGYLVFAVAILGMVGVSKVLNFEWYGLWKRFNRPPPPSPRRQGNTGPLPEKSPDIY